MKQAFYVETRNLKTKNWLTYRVDATSATEARRLIERRCRLRMARNPDRGLVVVEAVRLLTVAA